MLMLLDSHNHLPTCSICLETISSDRLITTPCGHTYHKFCLAEQVNNSTYDSYRYKCAHCRTDIETFLHEHIVSNMNVILYQEHSEETAHSVTAHGTQNIVSDWEIDELYRLLCYWDDYHTLFGVENSEDENHEFPSFEEFLGEL
jgi:hypothetical protein